MGVMCEGRETMSVSGEVKFSRMVDMPAPLAWVNERE